MKLVSAGDRGTITGWGARIRTRIYGSKVRCATVAPRPNDQGNKLIPMLGDKAGLTSWATTKSSRHSQQKSEPNSNVNRLLAQDPSGVLVRRYSIRTARQIGRLIDSRLPEGIDLLLIMLPGIGLGKDRFQVRQQRLVVLSGIRKCIHNRSCCNLIRRRWRRQPNPGEPGENPEPPRA